MSRRDKKRSHKHAPGVMPLLSEKQKESLAAFAIARILSLGFLRLPEDVALEEAKRYVASTLELENDCNPDTGSNPDDIKTMARGTEERLDMTAEWLYGIARRHDDPFLLLPHHIDMAVRDSMDRVAAILYANGSRTARSRSLKIVTDYFDWCQRRGIAILSIAYSMGDYSMGDRDDDRAIRVRAMTCVALNDAVANNGVISWTMSESWMIEKATSLLDRCGERLERVDDDVADAGQVAIDRDTDGQALVLVGEDRRPHLFCGRRTWSVSSSGSRR